MRAAGVRVIHVRMVDGKVKQDDGSIPAAAPARVPKSRKGK